MDLSIASILLLDGVTNGAIYALLAMATVLLFAVTRVIYIPQGEYVAFAALTVGLLQLGQVPGTVWFLLAMAALVAVLDAWAGWQGGQGVGAVLRQALRTLAWPVAVSALTIWLAPQRPP
ncbi:branched-chain amino acid ABC transporter permease, partial [Schlegelella sp. S2-27]|nr:branched-chain amino acid ABC transporter permease [Caldimonas mangrovi]